MKIFRKINSCLLALFFIIFALFSQGCSNSAKSLDLTIVHTNDIHGRVEYDKDNKVTGYAKMQTYIKDLKAKNKNVLLMDAGDALHGQPIVTLSQGEVEVSLLNLMGYNYFVPGNHDFNSGFSRLKKLSEGMKSKVLAANVCLKDGTRPFLANDLVEIDGVKIGIFGLATPETAQKTNPLNVKDLDFKDVVETSKDQVKDLKNKGAELIILIGHLGIDGESKGHRSYDIRDNVEGIDLIIDGHSHSNLEQIKQAEGKAVITSTGAYSENLGIVKIKLENGKKEITPSNVNFSQLESLEDDKEVSELINKIKKEQEPILKEVLGQSEIELDGKKSSVRAKETNLTKFLANAVLKETGAQVVLLNGGSFRSGINIGNITAEDIVKIAPFGNYIVTKKVTGEDIIKSLEHGLSSYPEVAARFPQIAGMTCTFNSKAKAGSRVISVKIGSKDINPNESYVLATNDFISAGGDGYELIGKSPEINHFSDLDEIFIKAVKETKTITKETINKLPDGYIIK